MASFFWAHLLQGVDGSLVALRYQLRCLVPKVSLDLVQVVIILEHGMCCTAWCNIPQHAGAADAGPLMIYALVDGTIPWMMRLVMQLSVGCAVARRSMHAAAPQFCRGLLETVRMYAMHASSNVGLACCAACLSCPSAACFQHYDRLACAVSFSVLSCAINQVLCAAG